MHWKQLSAFKKLLENIKALWNNLAKTSHTIKSIYAYPSQQ